MFLTNLAPQFLSSSMYVYTANSSKTRFLAYDITMIWRVTFKEIRFVFEIFSLGAFECCLGRFASDIGSEGITDTRIADYLSKALDSLKQRQEDESPGDQQAQHQRPPHRPDVMNALRDVQHVVTANMMDAVNGGGCNVKSHCWLQGLRSYVTNVFNLIQSIGLWVVFL